MPWSGSTYTKWNGTGGWTADAAAGVGIEAGRHDTQDTDFQDGINACLNKNGLNTPTTNLPMGGFRHTGVGNGTARTDYAAIGQVQDSTPMWGGTSAGTGTAYTLTLTPALTAYVTGQVFRWNAHTVVTGAATININGLGAKTLQRQGTALVGNEFKANDIIEMIYDGTQFQITNVPAAPLILDRTNNTAAIGSTTTNLAALRVVNANAGLPVGVFVSAVGSDSSLYGIHIQKTANDNTTAQRFVYFLINNGATASGQINANGANQAAFGTTSDVRLKENIVDIDSQLDNICALRPVEFDYKDGSGHQIGFIAQEVQTIYPDLVGTNSDGFLTLSDLSKNDARTIKAIQELNAKVEALEARVAELEG